MKSIKMCGIAVLMAMALVGASSAMAESTQLCNIHPGTGSAETCPSGNAVSSIHEVSVGKAKLLANPRVECDVLFASTSVGARGSPQITNGHFTYTNCAASSSSPCTVEEKEGTTAEIKVLKEGHETARVTGNARIIVNCLSIECTYNGEGLQGTAKGPLLSTEANGEVNLNEQEVTGRGSNCPREGKLDIKTTPLSATYIAGASSTQLCNVDPGAGSEETCPSGHAISSIHEVSVGKVKLLAEPRVECDVLFSSTSVGEAASPQIIRGHFTYTNCAASYSNYCIVEEEEGTTAETKVLKEGHETARVTGNARIIVVCAGIGCTYNGEGLVGTAKGPLLSTEANGEVNLNEQEVSGSGTFCPREGKLDIKTTPLSATYIAGASSTQLCNVDPGAGSEETCPSGHAISSIHEVSVGKAKLLASPRVECNVLFASTSVGALGTAPTPQVIKGHFTYTNCGCTVEERESKTAAEIRVLKEGHETAKVTGNARIIVTCFGIECTYNGEGLEGTAKGPLLSTEANGEVNLSEQEVRGKGFFCPGKAKLDIKTTPLSATYIAE